MASKKKWCKECKQNVRAIKDVRKIGCMAHFGFMMFTVIATLLTGGLGFIPMICLWMLCAFYDNSKFECPRCGSVCK